MRSLKQEIPALDPRLGPEFDQFIRDPQRVLVMLDHQHGVAAIAKRDQRVEQFLVVVRVQPMLGSSST